MVVTPMNTLNPTRSTTRNAQILLGVTSLVALLLPLAACAPKSLTAASTVPPGTPQDLRTHGEAVFRLQNAVLDQVIDAAQSDAEPSSTESADLLAAEERIVSSCQDLNEAASLGAQGQHPDLPLQLRVLKSMAGCEASALAVRAQLNQAPVRVDVLAP